jgi:hypothetical protein
MVDLVDQMSNPKSDAAVAGRLQAAAVWTFLHEELERAAR